MSNTDPQSHSIALTGLDGQNPLAFLAALGVLRALTHARPQESVSLSWAVRGGVWTPDLHTGQEIDQEHLLDNLDTKLLREATQHPIAFMNKEDKEDPPKSSLFRLRAGRSDQADRDALDWLSAMASDLAPDATSQLQTARRDYFWGNLESVMRLTTTDHLRRTLFSSWDYVDPLDNQSLHIEPSEDRRHAHQWSQPSGDPDRKKRGGMLGANRLAIEAFPLFQSIAIGDKLSTRGFTGVRANDIRWTWPLWDVRANLDVVASLLGLAELQHDSPDLRELSARGVCAVFRCRRILVGKTPNFTPAEPI